MLIPLLVTIELTQDNLSRIEAEGFEIHIAVAAEARAAFLKKRGGDIRAVLTNGSTGLNASEISALPALEIICSLGAGYENIDLSAAYSRGVVITNGPGTNGSSVADHAMALLMAAARGIVQADFAVRRGKWASCRQPRPSVSGKKLGILGMGNIGEQIASRGSRGFGMQVGYHNRTCRNNLSWLYLSSPAALAEWADFLVIATPGGEETMHLVDMKVLTALGEEGFLINIARGSVVDTAALIVALKERRIAGAALDVVEGEPDIPDELKYMENVILTPHIAGRSPEAVEATIQLVLDNLRAHFNGHHVLTRIV